MDDQYAIPTAFASYLCVAVVVFVVTYFFLIAVSPTCVMRKGKIRPWKIFCIAFFITFLIALFVLTVKLLRG